MKKPKTVLESFFQSQDLSLFPLFEELKTDSLNDTSNTPLESQQSIKVPRSGLPLSDVEEAESAIYGEPFIKIVYGNDHYAEALLPPTFINEFVSSTYAKLVGNKLQNYTGFEAIFELGLDEFVFFDVAGSLPEKIYSIINDTVVKAYEKLPEVDPVEEAALRYYFIAIKKIILSAVPDIAFLIRFVEKLREVEKKYRNVDYAEYVYSDLEPFRNKIAQEAQPLISPYINHLNKIQKMLMPYAQEYFGSAAVPNINPKEAAEQYIYKYLVRK